MVTARFLACLPWVALMAMADFTAIAVVVAVVLWLRRNDNTEGT